jgi:hypothetical protein
MRLIRVQLIPTKHGWVPVGNDTGLSHAQPMKTPARGALDDLCSLQLGKSTQHGQRQLVFGVLLVVLPVDRDLLGVLEKSSLTMIRWYSTSRAIRSAARK